MFNYTKEQESYFGSYGGTFIPESLRKAVQDLKESYIIYYNNQNLLASIKEELVSYSGRPTPLYHAKRWSRMLGGAQIFFKREDLNTTASHKINNVIGQLLLAKQMKKTRVIAETGAGQHGVAVATYATKLNLKCSIYMGAADAERQFLNVERMKLLGARVNFVSSGSSGLKEALSEAIRDWVTNSQDTFYVLGTASGPHPYPLMVRNFQRLIGDEGRLQSYCTNNKQPDAVVACIGGGSNAIGAFYPFLFSRIRLIGVEAAGRKLAAKEHAASLGSGSPGTLHGAHTYLIQNNNGQIERTHSIAAGLDYPGVGPEHSWLKDLGRVECSVVSDEEAALAFANCIRIEGIIPALETSHAIYRGTAVAQTYGSHQTVLINLSGSGEKDVRDLVKKTRSRGN